MRLHSHRAADVFLEPGQFYFGDGGLRIATLLGSCVAITMWNPRSHAGGMCHYLLPSRRPARGYEAGPADQALDGRFGDEALQMFLREFEAAGAAPSDYQAKLFGGGDQFPDASRANTIDVPARNVDAGLNLLADHGLHPLAKHVGGSGPRMIVLDLADGDVWVRHRRLLRPEHLR